jgi:hypothetical protein
MVDDLSVRKKIEELLAGWPEITKLGTSERNLLIRELSALANQVNPDNEEELGVFIEAELSTIARLLRSGREAPGQTVQKYFNDLRLSVEFGQIATKIGKLKLGDYEAAKALRKELDEFYKMAKKKDPEFKIRYADMVNETEGDLISIFTGGNIGSTRKGIELQRSGELKKWERRKIGKKGHTGP